MLVSPKIDGWLYALAVTFTLIGVYFALEAIAAAVARVVRALKKILFGS